MQANLVLAIESAEKVARELEAEQNQLHSIESEAATSLLALRAELAEVESEHRSFTHKRLPPWIAVFDSRKGKVVYNLPFSYIDPSRPSELELSNSRYPRVIAIVSHRLL